MNVNYAKLKSEMAALGIPVSSGDAFTPFDQDQYRKYVAYQNLQGERMTLASGFYGLAYPGALPEEVKAQVASNVLASNVKLWSEALQANGNLHVGSGNPGHSFQVANGESIQVGLAVRWFNYEGDYPEAQNGVIEIDAAKTFDVEGTPTTAPWTFLYSVATTGAATLSDYDITLTLTLDSTGEETPTAVFTYGAGDWVSSLGDHTITDSAGTADKVSQNVEQYAFAFIKSHLLPVEMQSETYPFGTYHLALKAVHTVSGEVTEVKVQVNVAEFTA